MTEVDVIRLVAAAAGGLLLGVLGTLLFNKLRSGSASPATIKQEFDDYQGQVEAHFEETSKKFKSMAEQYQDLYQHMSVGATSLCRPENQVAGLTDQSAPAADQKPAADQAPAANQKPAADQAPAADQKPAADQAPAADQKPSAKNEKAPTGDTASADNKKPAAGKGKNSADK